MTKATVIPSGIHAVFAVDPGGTSGVFAAYVELQPTVKETLLGIKQRKSVEVEGDWLRQGKEIGEMMKRFVFAANVERSLPMGSIHIAFEDFVLRRRTEGGATGNLTSCWVAAAAVASGPSEYPTPIAWYQASQTKSFASDARLRLWELWEVGSPHRRDAARVFATHIDQLVS